MMELHKLFLGAALLPLVSCTSYHHNEQPSRCLATLQVREAQTRSFEESDTKTVMKAMINVLQDEGYIVKNAVLDLGLLTAEKSIEVTEDKDRELISYFKGSDSKCCSRHAVIEMSANVTDYGDETTKVRLNFQKKTYDSKGGVVDVNQSLDDVQYQAFFAKVSKAIFFQSEHL